MKKTLTFDSILGTVNLLKRAKLDKMKEGESFQVVKALRGLKSVVTPVQELMDTAEEKLKPENYDEMMVRAQKYASLTDDEKYELEAVIATHRKRVNRCVNDELKKTTSIEISPISEESFNRLCESNTFTAGEMMTLMDVLCK